MASGSIGGQSDPAYVSAMTELHPHTTSLFQSPSSGMGGAASDLDSLSVLSAGTSGQHPVVGGARDNTMSLSHVLSGLQEEGTLAEVLQEQPNLAHGLNTIAVGDVSSDPESLRFHYQPSTDSLLQLQATASAPPAKRKEKAVYREQDRFLPLHNVARTMRNAIPPNGKVSKDAKECMQECVSEFISFITSEASDKCIAERRKTITGDDILFAMATLGFDNYIEPLRLYLQKWREFTRIEKVNTNLQTPAGSNSFPPPPPPSQAPVVLNHTSPHPLSRVSAPLQTDITSFTSTQSHP